MNDLIIEAMRQKGWSLHAISLRSGITQSRLERGVLGVREQRALLRVADEAGVDVDSLDPENA